MHAPARLLVMDVDSTFITAEVIELVAEHAGTRELVADITTRAMRGELDFASSLRERVSTLKGLPVEVLDAVRDSVQLTPGARELVAAAHQAGAHVGLVSGGFHEVLDPLARREGIDEWVANHFEVSQGRLTGRVTGAIIDRKAKEHYLRFWAEVYGVPMEQTIAVGDGANDLDMLAAAGLGVAFCAKPAVAQAADVSVTERDLRAIIPLAGWETA